MKITVVVDNCIMPRGKPFVAEHGLSLLIEGAGRKILFDAGQSGVAVHNLGLLGVHPREVDTMVLSHGHYDHTGGLAAVLEQAGKPMPVYCHPDAFIRRYVKVGGRERFVGVPHAREQLESLGAEFRFVTGPTEVAPGLIISGAIPRQTGYETGDASLLRPGPDGCGCLEQDAVDDDMAIYYADSGSLTVISGCAHSGIVNVVRHGLDVTGCGRVHAVIGGTHLGPVGKAQQEATLAELASIAPSVVAANHCTGFYMMARLQAQFGEKFIPAFVGTVIEV